MDKQPESKINPAWEALKPEDEGKTWFKWEDVCVVNKDSYKCIEISPENKKPE